MQTSIVYKIDLFNTGIPVEVMVGYSTYSQSGSLAVQLFTSHDGTLAKDYHQELSSLFTKPYAVITSNRVSDLSMGANKQFVDENRYPGIGEWLTRNGIAKMVIMSEFGYPLYQFFGNHGVCPLLDTWRTSKGSLPYRPSIPNFNSKEIVERSFVHDLVDGLEKSRSYCDIKTVLSQLADSLIALYPSLKSYIEDIVGYMSEVEPFVQYTSDPKSDIRHAETLQEAQTILQKYIDDYVHDSDNCERIAMGSNGMAQMIGKPYWLEKEFSTPVLIQDVTLQGMVVKEYCAVFDRYGERHPVGPYFMYDEYSQNVEFTLYSDYPYPSTREYICLFSLYGTLLRYSSPTFKNAELTSSYVEAVRNLVLSLETALEPLLAERKEQKKDE